MVTIRGVEHQDTSSIIKTSSSDYLPIIRDTSKLNSIPTVARKTRSESARYGGGEGFYSQSKPHTCHKLRS